MSRYTFVQGIKNQPGMCLWKALDEVTQKTVLAKAVSKDAGALALHQFRTEARLLSQLDSPWIPRLLDMEETESALVLYEEFLEGETLSQWLQNKPSRKQKQKIFVQIVRLIGLVHQAGYLYMDLKADNIMICQDHACLIDFNGAVETGSQKPLLSNIYSLPPEAVSGNALDEKADQIGLGHLHRLLFKNSRVSWTCLRRDPARRFATLQDLERACCSFDKRPLALGALSCLCLVLAFGLVRLESRESPLSISTPALLAGALQQAKQDCPQDWLGQMLRQTDLSEDLYKDPQCLSLLGQAALESRQAYLCQYVLDRSDLTALESLPHIRLLLLCASGSSWNREDVQSALEYLTSQADGALLAQVLEAFQSQSLFIPSSLDKQLESALEALVFVNTEQAIVILEYLIHLQSLRNCYINIPNTIVSLTESSGDLRAVYNAYRRNIQ